MDPPRFSMHYDINGKVRLLNHQEFPSYEEHHRDIVQEALTNRKVCPNCDTHDCSQKCSRCKSVFYCNSRCQVAHWPKHKRICNEFDHVEKVASEMSYTDRMEFLYHIASVLYARLRMVDVYCEVTLFTYYNFHLSYHLINQSSLIDPGVNSDPR